MNDWNNQFSAFHELKISDLLAWSKDTSSLLEFSWFVIRASVILSMPPWLVLTSDSDSVALVLFVSYYL
jgi:hypothetical protein